jgi:hypothetical protein
MGSIPKPSTPTHVEALIVGGPPPRRKQRSNGGGPTANGSPEPIFHTDQERAFFLAEFPLHQVFVSQEAPQVAPEVKAMLGVMKGEMTRGEIQEQLGLKDEKHFRVN